MKSLHTVGDAIDELNGINSMTGEDVASIEAWERGRVIGATVIAIADVVKLAILEVERESLWEEKGFLGRLKWLER